MTAVRFEAGATPPSDGVSDPLTRALGTVPEHRSVAVDGARIAYRAWGEQGRTGVVLVHGGAAHSGWWDHIGPQLSGHRVIAPDMSGYGDSEHRPSYSKAMWARELAEVALAEDLDRPVVVGHSKGGWVSIAAGVQHADVFSAVVAI